MFLHDEHEFSPGGWHDFSFELSDGNVVIMMKILRELDISLDE